MARSGTPFDPQNLLVAFETQPSKLEKLIAGMTPAELRRRPGPRDRAGTWSTLELVCHLSDTEQAYADRIKRTLAMDRPLVLAYDESAYVRKLACHRRDVEEEILLMLATRRQIARILRTLKGEDWERSAVHNQAGLRTLRQWIETLVWHLDYHAAFIGRKRAALGRRARRGVS